MKRLRVGIEVKRKRWPEQLPKAVRIAERSKRLQHSAEKVAAQLAREDGPGEVVRELEDLVGRL